MATFRERLSSAALLLVLIGACAVTAQDDSSSISGIKYKTLLRGGQVQNVHGEPINSKGLAFLQVFDNKGNGVYSLDGSKNYQVAVDPDYTSIIKTSSGRIFTISAYEYTMPSGMYITELQQNRATGELSPLSTKTVDWSKWGGIIAPCAGSQSPWNSHLHGEELCPDARAYETATTAAGLPREIRGREMEYARYWQLYNISSATTFANGIQAKPYTLDAFKANFNPYKYGWAMEVRIDGQGRTNVRKLYLLGRTAQEAPICMPDKRTCYVSDDSGGAVFPKFVANRAGDLTSGTLYAAKLTQVSAANGGSFTISWIRLASGTQNEIKAMIDGNIKFSSIFEAATPTSPGVCPSGFSPVQSSANGFECLKLKAGMEKAAAFLETRRYASYVGATTEINRFEGIDIHVPRKKLYVTATLVGVGMLDNGTADVGGPNDIRLPLNNCGCVYELAMDNNWNVVSMKAIVCGIPVDKNTNNGQECDVDGLASPDNIAVIEGTNSLVIYEDTSRHINNMLWTMDIDDPSTLTRIGSAPYGAEWTSGNYVRNINGWDYLVAVVQHPYEDSAAARLTDGESTGAAAWVGYYGPFPTSAMQGDISVQFDGVPVATQAAQHQVVASDSVTLS